MVCHWSLNNKMLRAFSPKICKQTIILFLPPTGPRERQDPGHADLGRPWRDLDPIGAYCYEGDPAASSHKVQGGHSDGACARIPAPCRAAPGQEWDQARSRVKWGWRGDSADRSCKDQARVHRMWARGKREIRCSVLKNWLYLKNIENVGWVIDCLMWWFEHMHGKGSGYIKQM